MTRTNAGDSKQDNRLTIPPTTKNIVEQKPQKKTGDAENPKE
jgi:hypothetical protein